AWAPWQQATSPTGSTSGARRLSAWRNSNTSPRARRAPAFICLALPRSAATTNAPAAAARAGVPSSLPPSTTITSTSRESSAGRRSPSSAGRFPASLRAGMITETAQSGEDDRAIYALAPPPAVVALHPAEQARGRVGPPPLPCHILVRLTQGRVAVECAEQLVETRSEEHTSELQSRENVVCRLQLEKKTREEQKANAAAIRRFL